jgi:hypothetical protein
MSSFAIPQFMDVKTKKGQIILQLDGHFPGHQPMTHVRFALPDKKGLFPDISPGEYT